MRSRRQRRSPCGTAACSSSGPSARVATDPPARSRSAGSAGGSATADRLERVHRLAQRRVRLGGAQHLAAPRARRRRTPGRPHQLRRQWRRPRPAPRPAASDTRPRSPRACRRRTRAPGRRPARARGRSPSAGAAARPARPSDRRRRSPGSPCSGLHTIATPSQTSASTAATWTAERTPLQLEHRLRHAAHALRPHRRPGSRRSRRFMLPRLGPGVLHLRGARARHGDRARRSSPSRSATRASTSRTSPRATRSPC